jgi:hypothetical protein
LVRCFPKQLILIHFQSHSSKLEELLKHSNFFKLNSARSELTNKKGAADYYTYNITVEEGGKKHSVICNDLSMTKSLRDLISSLSKLKT